MMRDLFKITSVSEIDTLFQEYYSLFKEEILTIYSGSSFDQTYGVFDRSASSFYDLAQTLSFIGDCHEAKDVREYAAQTSNLINEKINEVLTKDLLLAMSKYAPSNEEQIRLVSVVNKSFEDLGIFQNSGLDTASILKVTKEIDDLSTAYNQRLNNNDSFLIFSESELIGMSPKFISDRKIGDQVKVTADYTDFYPIISHCANPDVRAKVFDLFNNIGGQTNVDALQKIRELRQELARLFGVPFIQYKIKDRMANQEQVDAVLQDYKNTYVSKWKDSSLPKLRAMKKQADGSDVLLPSDLQYFNTKLSESFLGGALSLRTDFSKVKNFVLFELPGYFGLNTVQLSDYSNDIESYLFSDENGPVGKIHISFHPRAGKYGHAAQYSLVSGRTGFMPVAGILVNVARDQLDLEETLTIFHEFGHLFHDLLTKVNYGHLSGTNTAFDFCEAPSQANEFLLDDVDFLKRMFGDVDPIAFKQYVENERVFGVLSRLNRSYLDFAIHSSNKPLRELELEIYKDIYSVEPTTNGIVSRFDHITGGYEASYYVYLYSEKYAELIFNKLRQDENFLKPGMRSGILYKDMVLSKGNSVDPLKMMDDYLKAKG